MSEMKKNLRVLYVPLWSNRDLARCSTMNWAKVFLPRLLENPNVFLYLPIPKDMPVPFDWASVGLDHPRVMKIPMRYHISEYASFKQIDEMSKIQYEMYEQFGDFCGRYFLDAVIVDKPEVLVTLKNFFVSPYTSSCVPPIFVANTQYAIGADVHKKFQDSLFMAQSAGLAQADVITFVNENSMERALKYCRKHLAPSYTKQIMERSHFYLNGVNIARVEAYKVPEKPASPMTVSYGYGMNRVYQFEELFEIFDKLFCSGRDVQVLVNTNSGGVFGWDWGKYEKHFKIRMDCSQDEFFKTIAPAHAFLFMAKEFEMSYSACEKHLLGLVGVYLDSPRVRNIVYKGYPYIGKNPLQLATILRHVLENYHSEEVQEVQRKQVEFIKKKYDGVHNAYELCARIEEAVQKRDDEYGRQFRGKKLLLHEIFKNEKEVTYDQFLQKIKDGTENGIDIRHNYGRYALSKSVWRHVMTQIGFVDNCQVEDPTFVRVSDWSPDADTSTEEEAEVEPG